MSKFILVYPAIPEWDIPEEYFGVQVTSSILQATHYDTEKAANEEMRRIRGTFGGAVPIVKQVAA